MSVSFVSHFRLEPGQCQSVLSVSFGSSLVSVSQFLSVSFGLILEWRSVSVTFGLIPPSLILTVGPYSQSATLIFFSPGDQPHPHSFLLTSTVPALELISSSPTLTHSTRSLLGLGADQPHPHSFSIELSPVHSRCDSPRCN